MKNRWMVCSVILVILAIVLSITCIVLLQTRVKTNDYISDRLLSGASGISQDLAGFSEGNSESLQYRLDAYMEYINLYEWVNSNTQTSDLYYVLMDTRTVISDFRTSSDTKDKEYLMELLKKIQPFITQLVFTEEEIREKDNHAMWKKKLQQFNEYYSGDDTDYTEIHLECVR